ncbi:LysR family transcriptional regulator [Vibrio tarriae]|uniref:LysR family transcriptional regulator n=2 Tax=Vibrio tarriae TaxID=2014742 RepID=A0AAU8WAB8_9VIBR|nr:LysR family transcriptional regulator [Vibrio tarriae]RBM25831.1 LysR family transcriptional regulator [Vibrio tarriae]RBM39203.1 LysR family transcriptional regulator [Vibrio tarriae]
MYLVSLQMRALMDRLTAMRSFIEVANTASFTQAADNLNLSRLQVSRHVQEIEDWLKQRLLHRTTRRVSLTAAGEEALQRCEQILHQTMELEMRALEQSGALRGSIRISAPIGLTQNMLLDAVIAFTDLHPQVHFDVLASDRFSQLVDERVDIALRFTQQPDENLIARRLLEVGMVVCATQEYLVQHAPIELPQDLAHHNCLVHISGNKWDFVKNNEQFSVLVNGNIRANDMGTLCRAALNHKGIIRLPCDLANPLLQAGQLQALLPNYYLPSSSIWAVYLSRSYQTPLVRQFIDFLAERWQEDLLWP